MTVWSVFETVVSRHAARVAVEVQRAQTLDSWTYRDLHTAAQDYSIRVVDAGVQAGDRCAILADNDAHWCAAYLGILRVGAIAVPLDTNYTAAQVATIVADAGPRVLFVNDRLRATAEAAAGQGGALRVEVLGPRTTALAGVPATGEPDPSMAAVILYTSGTTADPKGVVLTHANLLAERDAAFAVVKVSETDSVLGVLPLFHALAQLANLLLPFTIGARVVFLETLNSTELVRALSDRGITIFACVPQFFYLIHQRILGEVARGGLVRRALFRMLLGINLRLRAVRINAGRLFFAGAHTVLGRRLRLFVSGGSRFDPAVGRDFYALGFNVLQAYGLTETSGAVTLTALEDAGRETVGRALPGHQIRVLPPEDRGRDGEIAVRGPAVMQGYFNRPDATASVIRDGWLLTGDLGSLDESGRLTITGRKKEVIVLASGKNIYPEEVEAQYQRSAYVKEICVMGLTRPGDPTSERLFAVVVPDMALMRERRIVNAGDLLRFELEGQSIHLPAHKRVLGYEVWFEPLPRTTTGKLKRHEIEARIRERQRHRSASGDAAAAAVDHWRDDRHGAAVAALIARHAKGAAVVPAANLELDLGLDSMERVELIAELERRFGVRLEEGGAAGILTVAQLVDAVRPGETARVIAAAEPSWAVLLRELPPPTDPMVASLQERRRLMPLVFFVMLRLLRLVMPRVIVTGRENLPMDGPYIISPNHQSYLDPFFVCSVLPYRTFRRLFFVGAAEYFETAVTAWAARQFNLVPVDPDANLVPAMKAGAFGLAKGRILVLFPEGERSIDGTVKRFKKGAPILSRHVNVPIVPVAIHGIFELWPRNRPFNWRLLVPRSGHRVQLAFGRPMSGDHSLSYSDAATALREQVHSMWQVLDASSPHRQQQDGRDHAAHQEKGGLNALADKQ